MGGRLGREEEVTVTPPLLLLLYLFSDPPQSVSPFQMELPAAELRRRLALVAKVEEPLSYTL